MRDVLGSTLFIMFVCVLQIGTKNSIELLEDDREAAVNRVAQELGLTRVGWIFTDLVAEDTKKGTVKHVRGNVVSVLGTVRIWSG